MDGLDAFSVTCPYCGEDVEIHVEEDVRGSFVQDCEVCCNPWLVRVTRSADGADVSVGAPTAPNRPVSPFLFALPLILLPIFIVLVVVALIPLAIIQRFRRGTMRARPIGWLIALNFAGTFVSMLLFLLGAAITTQWIPGTLTYTAAGLGIGGVLGVLGLALTRWEVAGGRLYYTPNRWLVLTITLVVTGRLAYGFWRSWEAWQASMDTMTWVAASGVAASMSAGAIVLGYYLVYWFGVRRRLRRARFGRV